MRHIVILFVALVYTPSLPAQMADLSGHWINNNGGGANWAQLRDQVWFVSINRDWKAFFEGKVLSSGDIAGRLVKINLHTWQREETLLEFRQKNRQELIITTPSPADGSYTAGGNLRFAGYYSAYDSITAPVFDEKHRAWEVKTWFQDGDTIASVFIGEKDPVVDKGVFINKDSLQIIRQIKWTVHPCYTKEVLHCKLGKDGRISAKARNIDGACMANTDRAWTGATYRRYSPTGGYPPFSGLIDPHSVIIPPDILQLKIDTVRIGGRVAGYGPNALRSHPLSVKEYQDITVQFSSGVAGIRLFYQLKGFETAWHLSSTSQEANYTRLSGGNYTFIVTTDPDHPDIEGNTKTLSFRVFRPLYRQGGFYGLFLLSVAVLMIWGFRWREQQRRTLEQLRQRIARELHDDIGSTVSSISILTAAAKRHIKEPRSNIPLDLIGNKAQEALDHIGDIIWMMQSEEISNADLLQRMKSFAVEILEAQGIRLHFPDAGEAAVLPLTVEKRKELYLLFKEAVNNAAKYSNASEVHIGLNYRNNRLHLEIRDNGRGFNPADTPHGNGLASMRRRAERLGGKLQIESAPELGTSIRLEV